MDTETLIINPFSVTGRSKKKKKKHCQLSNYPRLCPSLLTGRRRSPWAVYRCRCPWTLSPAWSGSGSTSWRTAGRSWFQPVGSPRRYLKKQECSIPEPQEPEFFACGTGSGTGMHSGSGSGFGIKRPFHKSKKSKNQKILGNNAASTVTLKKPRFL